MAKRGGRRPGAGRPRASISRRSVTVRLNPEMLETALELGEGCVTRGIELALLEAGGLYDIEAGIPYGTMKKQAE